MPKHFLRDDDLTPGEQAAVLDLAGGATAGMRVCVGAPESVHPNLPVLTADRLHAQKALIAWLLEQT